MKLQKMSILPPPKKISPVSLKYKVFPFVVLIAFLGIISFSLVSCGGDDNNDPVQIGAVGGIPVYRTADVSVADGEAALAEINIFYEDYLDAPGNKETFVAALTTINIVSGSDVILKGTVLEVGANADSDDIANYCMPEIVYKT